MGDSTVDMNLVPILTPQAPIANAAGLSMPFTATAPPLGIAVVAVAVGALPARKLRDLVEQARVYAFEFLAWKKAFVLRKHWLVHNRSRCPRHDIPLTRAYLGKTNRRSFYCELCQKRYSRDSIP